MEQQQERVRWERAERIIFEVITLIATVSFLVRVLIVEFGRLFAK